MPMTSEIYIPGFTITCLLITAVICIVAVLAGWYTVRSRIKFSQIILGAFAYVLVMLLQNLLGMLGQRFPDAGVWYALYIALYMAAARELIRYLAVRFGVKTHFDDTDASIGFALGFAGMYLLICGAYYFNCYTVASEYVKTGIDAFVVNAGENSADALDLLKSIAAQGPWQFICTGVCRVLFLVREIALCVLLWYAMTIDGKRFYYLFVPIMSFLAFLPDGLYQAEILGNSCIRDIASCVISAAAAVPAARLYNTMEDQVAHFRVERLRARRKR